MLMLYTAKGSTSARGPTTGELLNEGAALAHGKATGKAHGLEMKMKRAYD